MKKLNTQKLHDFLQQEKNKFDTELLIMNATDFFDSKYDVQSVKDVSTAINSIYQKALHVGELQGKMKIIVKLMEMFEDE